MRGSLDPIRPSVVQRLLAAHGLRRRHSLGQHFLTDRHTLDRILEAAELARDDGVIEVGPGLGVLTLRLAAAAGRVVAIELDRSLFPALSEVLRGVENAEVRHGDATRLDWRAVGEELTRRHGCRTVKVCANLPYQVTTPVITGVLESGLPFERAVLMVQREVAERVAAPPGSRAYGSISVLVQYFTEPEIVVRVPPGAFSPPPRVDSAVLLLRRRAAPPVRSMPERLFPVVRAGFSQRRKTLGNALSAGLRRPKADVRAALELARVAENRRAETLGLAEWDAVARALGGDRATPPGGV